MSDPRHPNKLPFEGVLTLLGIPSDAAPRGSRSHRVILPADVAAEALPSLIGMAVSYKDGWGGHNARQKCGIITDAQVIHDELHVRGYLYDRDFPEVAEKIREGRQGMSYEIADAWIEDMRADHWVMRRVTFTGAAILYKHKAAYQSTSIRLVEHPRFR